MTLKQQLRARWAAARWNAALAALSGVVALLFLRFTPLERWSYDLPYLVRPGVTITNVVIVYMDDLSHARLNQPYEGAWDRSLHARLVDVLTRAGAKAIAFDVLFDKISADPAGSEALAKSIRSHGRVVLGADLGSTDYYGELSGVTLLLPHTNLLAATPYWGFVQLDVDPDDSVRKHRHGWRGVPSLSWELATVLGVEATQEPDGQYRERWLNYYGPHKTIRGLSFQEALGDSQAAVRNFVRDCVVFVGSASPSGFSGKRRDQFHTPYSGPTEPSWPGVDFHATQFLNLARGDWLRRMAPFAQLFLVLGSGLLAGVGLSSLRPIAATGFALGAAGLVAVAACVLVWQTHIWFSWLAIAAVQIPVALVCSLVRRREHEIAFLSSDRTTDFPASGSRGSLVIADYEMLRRIGSGSYGEVWLARSATGAFRAVKVVNRTSATDPRFEREFAGLKKFEPISRAHEGLVHILHVGRNETAGQLYYVMELADTCGCDPNIDPVGYVPATLKTRLQSGVALETDEIARLSLALASALAFLHAQGLIHRDIKPSNIIFVQNQPKLADIGLVAAADATLSFVGTEGYIPPEGPGTPAADVFSLGKVLSELRAETDRSIAASIKMSRLQEVIEQACARDLSRRPNNGQELLSRLQAALDLSAVPGGAQGE